MILPDDKNPTIVWDAEKKKWINTDEGEDSHESFAPPPKMADIATQFQPHQPEIIQQPHLTQPQNVTVPTVGMTNTLAAADPQALSQVRSSGLQSNMFKMQRNRSMKHLLNILLN